MPKLGPTTAIRTHPGSGGAIAIKVAPVAESPHWQRELQLAAALPATVGNPPILDIGVTDGYRWIVTELIEGNNLEHVWPHLSWHDRVRATQQIWARATAVHEVDLARVADLAPSESKFYPASPQAARTGLARLQAIGLLDTSALPSLHAILDRHWQARRAATNVLNHGDFATCNALWDGADVVSLHDFEMAIIAPPQLDLNELIKIAYAPHETPALPSASNTAGIAALQDVVAELAAPDLRTQAHVDLLMGFSIQLEIWVTETQLIEPWTDQPPEKWQSCQLLNAIAESDNGYYDALLKRLDIRSR